MPRHGRCLREQSSGVRMMIELRRFLGPGQARIGDRNADRRKMVGRKTGRGTMNCFPFSMQRPNTGLSAAVCF